MTPEERELEDMLDRELFRCSICGNTHQQKERALDNICVFCADKEGDVRQGEE